MTTLPPHNLRLEGAILSSVMVDNHHLDIVAKMHNHAFYSSANRAIHAAICEMHTAGLAVDLVSLNAYLGDKVNAIGGVAYLAGLDDGTASSVYIPMYARQLSALYGQRRMMDISAKLNQTALNGSVDDAVAIGAMDDIAAALGTIQGVPYRAPEAKHLDSWMDLLGGLSGEVAREYIPTGYPALDQIITGFEPSTFTVIGARPSMGKTAFALGLALNAAKSGKKVLFFSLETPQKALNQRLLAIETSISANRIKSGEFSPAEAVKLAVASAELMNLPIIIIDDARVTVADIGRLVAKYQPDLVIIDYLQLITGAEKSGTREQEIAGISRGIKHLRMQSNAAFVVLSQLSRAVETRPNHRPMLSDLRESGSIEQDANVVMFLYRDEHYNPETDQQGIAEIIVGKNRDGEIGTAKLGWDASRTRFFNL